MRAHQRHSFMRRCIVLVLVVFVSVVGSGCSAKAWEHDGFWMRYSHELTGTSAKSWSHVTLRSNCGSALAADCVHFNAGRTAWTNTGLYSLPVTSGSNYDVYVTFASYGDVNWAGQATLDKCVRAPMGLGGCYYGAIRINRSNYRSFDRPAKVICHEFGHLWGLNHDKTKNCMGTHWKNGKEVGNKDGLATPGQDAVNLLRAKRKNADNCTFERPC